MQTWGNEEVNNFWSYYVVLEMMLCFVLVGPSGTTVSQAQKESVENG